MRVITFYKQIFAYFTEHYSHDIEQKKIDLVYVDPKTLEYDASAKVLIGGRVNADNLSKLPGLKLIMVPFTGLNGLDLETIEAKNIAVTNTSAHAVFVAERALGLLLALRGNIVSGHIGLLHQYWSNHPKNDSASWHTIRAKKIAIYGYGQIGREVARLLKPFNTHIGITSYKNRRYEETLSFSNLESLCDWCDVLVITAPLTDITSGTINDSLLKNMNNKMIINVGRGAIIEESAIYNRLRDGTLAGFASDVWYNYPTAGQPDCWPSQYPFQELPNVVMTPHNAGFEVSSAHVRYDDIWRKLMDFI